MGPGPWLPGYLLGAGIASWGVERSHLVNGHALADSQPHENGGIYD